jgi:hypothetical protein
MTERRKESFGLEEGYLFCCLVFILSWTKLGKREGEKIQLTPSSGLLWPCFPHPCPRIPEFNISSA